MSYVEFQQLPKADPVGGFVLHCKNYMFGVQEMDLPKDIGSDQVCAVTMYPLNDLPKIGALVWAHKRSHTATASSSEEEKSAAIQWRFVCLPDEHDGRPGSQAKLHLFDFDSIRGFVENEKDYTKCPLCKRGSSEKAKVSQIDVSFTEDLLAQRMDCLRSGTPDYQMALFYEIQIVRQVVVNDEEKHKPSILEMVRNWNSATILHSLEATLQVCYEKDRAPWFKDFLHTRNELCSPECLLSSLEQACRYEAAGIVIDLITEFKPPVSKFCFEYLIGHRNEYLIDQLLDYYSKWATKEGGATPEQLLRHDDWLSLGRFAVIRREFPYFVKAVQLKNIYRLLDRIRMDDTINDALLTELGLKMVTEDAYPAPTSMGSDGWDEWNEGDENDEAWEE